MALHASEPAVRLIQGERAVALMVEVRPRETRLAVASSTVGAAPDGELGEVWVRVAIRAGTSCGRTEAPAAGRRGSTALVAESAVEPGVRPDQGMARPSAVIEGAGGHGRERLGAVTTRAPRSPRYLARRSRAIERARVHVAVTRRAGLCRAMEHPRVPPDAPVAERAPDAFVRAGERKRGPRVRREIETRRREALRGVARCALAIARLVIELPGVWVAVTGAAVRRGAPRKALVPALASVALRAGDVGVRNRQREAELRVCGRGHRAIAPSRRGVASRAVVGVDASQRRQRVGQRVHPRRGRVRILMASVACTRRLRRRAQGRDAMCSTLDVAARTGHRRMTVTQRQGIVTERRCGAEGPLLAVTLRAADTEPTAVGVFVATRARLRQPEVARGRR